MLNITVATVTQHLSANCLQVISPVLQMSSRVPVGVASHQTLCVMRRTTVVMAQTSWSVHCPPVAPVNSSVEIHRVFQLAGCVTTTLTARQEMNTLK